MKELIQVNLDTQKHLLTIVSQEMRTFVFADNVLLNGVFYIDFEVKPDEPDDYASEAKCVLTVDKNKFALNHKGARILHEDGQLFQ
ncbi:hypothetical protein LbDm2_2023 [Levilactobacillus brevis]|uniref:hypothetical protein n=1 Tax=Levilactobacillus brevis TaxID=1580 RepID=UPI00057DBFAB|nr:hypothetical protein [Levilactobacillus brevis]KID43089.1 hypothetical protein LbDm2_2023 [Levilactobacillus brevis]